MKISFSFHGTNFMYNCDNHKHDESPSKKHWDLSQTTKMCVSLVNRNNFMIMVMNIRQYYENNNNRNNDNNSNSNDDDIHNDGNNNNGNNDNDKSKW